jgi:GAF domain-containing protein
VLQLRVCGPAALQAALYDLKNRHYRARGGPDILQRVCTDLRDVTGADFQLLPAPEQDVDMDAYVQCLRRYKEGRAPMSLEEVKRRLRRVAD